MQPHLNVWQDKYGPDVNRPRRLLALDGGGILGIISLEILLEFENQLADMTGQGSDFRLGKFFDYIGGTSTGSIVAAGLAIGMSVQELIDFYHDSGAEMFTSRWLLKRAHALYKADPLRKKLQKVLRDRTLGAEDLECLLLVVTRNATTDSPWPLSNNPFAVFNDRNSQPCNLDIPLWELVRASTAAPIYFPPEELDIDKDQTFTFVDGGVTPYNNPAFLLYRMATAPQYRLGWPTGEDKMMLISVGTGSTAKVDLDLDESGQFAGRTLVKLPGVLMGGAAVDQDINCRAMGRCVFGREIDLELGDMIPRHGDPLSGDLFGPDEDAGRHFLYARYDPDVSEGGLKDLGLADIDPTHVQAMDKVDYLDDMQRVGKSYAAKHVDIRPFERLIQP